MGSQVDSREGRFGELRFKAKGLGLGFRELQLPRPALQK